MKNITITDKSIETFVSSHAAVEGVSYDVVVEKLLQRAIKDIQYRSQRNAQKWQEQKAMKQTLEELQRKIARIESQE